MKEIDVIYARQSKDKKDSLSIEFQIDRAIEDCKSRGMEYIIYFDKGYSAGSTKRPDFQILLSDIKKGTNIKLPTDTKVKNIVIYRYDRFVRSMKDFCDITEDFKKYRIGIRSISQQIDTSTASGRAMVMQFIVWAQYERELDSERISDNLYDRCSIGRWYGGIVPLGMKTKRVIAFDGKSYPQPYRDETESLIIDRIFNDYLSIDGSSRKIASAFNNEKILTKNSNTWSGAKITRIIKNPLYAPNSIEVYNYFKNNTKVTIFNDITEFDATKAVFLLRRYTKNGGKRPEEEQILFIGKWSPMTKGNVWIMANQKLNNNTHNKAPNEGKGKISILSGLLICGECLKNKNKIHKMHIAASSKTLKNSEKYRYFKCRGKTDFGNIYCQLPNTKVTVIEKMVEDTVFNHINNEELMKEIVKNQETTSDKEIQLTEELKKYNTELAVIESKIYHLLDTFSDASMKEVVQQQVLTLNNQQKELQSKIKQLNYEIDNIQQTNYSLSNIKKRAKNFKYIYSNCTLEEKKVVLRGFIRDIEVYNTYIIINFFDYSETVKLISCKEKDTLIPNSAHCSTAHKDMGSC